MALVARSATASWRARSWAPWLAAASLCCACGDDDPPGAPDAGVPDLDAELGSIDAASPDLGPATEAGVPRPGPDHFVEPARYDCRAGRVPPAPPERPYGPGCHHDPACATPLVIAARGASVLGPENTLASVRGAIALGVDIVELDVRRTADGALVMLHDEEVERTTDGTGRLAELALDEVRALRIVADPDDPPGDWSCERIPTLDDVLELSRGRIVVGFRVADPTPGLEAPPDVDCTMRALGSALRDLDVEDDAFVYCLDSTQCARARSDAPFLPVAMRAGTGELAFHAGLELVPAPVILEIEPTVELLALAPQARTVGARVSHNALRAADPQAALLGDLSGYDALLEAGAEAMLTGQPHLALLALGRLEE